jgi:hypothetical protein
VEPGQDPKTQARSRVFEFKYPKAVVGLCEASMKPTIAASDVEERQGCLVSLTWDGAAFEGATEGKGCASTLNGASYATSEVTITQDQIRSWDRGFDAADKQVWGATDGPYVFDRKTPIEPR